jgi:hypothetical protein
MAYAVLEAVARRLERDGRLAGPLPEAFLLPADGGPRPAAVAAVERPPLADLRAAA